MAPFCVCLLAAVTIWRGAVGQDPWEGELGLLPEGRPADMPRLSGVEVACGKRHMRVQLQFTSPFHGIVFSKGHHGQPDCVYVRPGSGLDTVHFDVFYDKCGTKPDHQGNFYENTIVVQYGVDIIEAWDEAKRLRCEWHDAYEKSALKTPSIQLADLEVQELNFQGDSVGCWMEIQEGKGPWAKEVSSIVPLGSPLTMVIAINDKDKQFDMRVKSCRAHDGVRVPIQLTDDRGCVLRPKMLTSFAKIRDFSGRASVLSFSHFYAFKFPDSIEVQIQCVVEICRHGCPDDCPAQHLYAASTQREKVEKSPANYNRDRPPSNDVEEEPVRKPPDRHRFQPPRPPMPTVAIGTRPGHAFVPPQPPSPFRPPPNVFSVPQHQVPFGMRLPRPPVFDANPRQPSFEMPVRPVQPVRFVPPIPDVETSTQRVYDVPTPEPEPVVTTSNTRFSPEIGRPTAPPSITGPVYVPPEDGSEEVAENGEPDFYTTTERVHTVPPVHHKFYIPPPGRPSPQFLGDWVWTTPREENRGYDPQTTTTATLEDPDQAPEDSALFDDVTHRPADEDSTRMHRNDDVPVAEPTATFSPIRPAGDAPDPVTYKPPRPYYPYPVPKFAAGTTTPAVLQDRIGTEPETESTRATVTKTPITEVVQDLQPAGRFPSGPRSLRIKRDAGGQLGVTGILKVVSSVDLAFLPNATSDGARLYRGHYEEVIYGVCLPATGLAAGLGAFVLLILCTSCVSAYLLYVLRTYRAKDTQSFLLSQLLSTYRGRKIKR